jgi:hypothetical protein
MEGMLVVITLFANGSECRAQFVEREKYVFFFV